LPAGPTLLGVRPEDLAVATGPAGTRPALSARIRLVEPTGPEELLVATHAGGEVIAAVRGDHALAGGDGVVFTFESGRMHFFSPETGMRLGA
jgi:multiple sugar transport system ATP-binding protein